jgi:lipoate-protein ligase A
VKKVILLDLQKTPLLDQLRLEEALLRLSDHTFCLNNWGTSPTFVMGISGEVKALFQESPFPIIRRYSGGGAVIIDEGSLLFSFVGNHSWIGGEINSHHIHEWAFPHFQNALNPLPLELRENDYCLREKKVGGNAQSITNGRFVHHTSLLWDFSDERMDLLKIPSKIPAYRQNRSHLDFVMRLCHFLDDPSFVIHQFIDSLSKSYEVEKKCQSVFAPLLKLPHRKITMYTSRN